MASPNPLLPELGRSVAPHQADPDSIYFVQVTDTHLFGDPGKRLLGVNTQESFEAVIKAVSNLDPTPEFLLLTGDLAQDGTPATYTRLKHHLQTIGIPCYWLAGNHDKLLPMHTILEGEGIHPQKRFSRGNWTFILLNSHRPGKDSGHLDPVELEALQQALTETASSGQHVLLSLHHPPFEVQAQWLDGSALQEPEQLFEILDPFDHVRLVLCGHVHQDFQYSRHGVDYLSCPSTCIQFKPQSDTFSLDVIAPGFRQVWLHADGSFGTHLNRVPEGFRQPDLQIGGY